PDDEAHIVAMDVLGKPGTVIEHPAIAVHRIDELAQRRPVQRAPYVGPGHQWRVDLLMREAGVPVRSAGPHLRAIGGKPGDCKSSVEARFGQDLAEQENALAPESSDLDSIFGGAGRSGRTNGSLRRNTVLGLQ